MYWHAKCFSGRFILGLFLFIRSKPYLKRRPKSIFETDSRNTSQKRFALGQFTKLVIYVEMAFMDWLTSPWPWYIAGPIIGLTVPLLYLIDNKRFGISRSLQHLCSVAGSKLPLFSYNWRKEIWNLVFVAGILVGSFLTGVVLPNQHGVNLNPTVSQELQQMGVSPTDGFAPEALLGIEALSNVKTLIFLLLGGLLVGFGTRWASGCTSGHSISGLAALQWQSLVATIGFFVGGLIAANWLLPILMGWLK